MNTHNNTKNMVGNSVRRVSTPGDVIMKISIEFHTGNDAFNMDPMAEAQSIIVSAMEQLRHMRVDDVVPLHDHNGQRVGQVATPWMWERN